jgi:hypothetical protein
LFLNGGSNLSLSLHFGSKVKPRMNQKFTETIVGPVLFLQFAYFFENYNLLCEYDFYSCNKL